MKGQRLPDGFTGNPPRGAFWKDEQGIWLACTPNGRIGVLLHHDVYEHRDGMITVTPSIQVDAIDRPGLQRPAYHGHLALGEWIDV